MFSRRICDLLLMFAGAEADKKGPAILARLVGQGPGDRFGRFAEMTCDTHRVSLRSYRLANTVYVELSDVLPASLQRFHINDDDDDDQLAFSTRWCLRCHCGERPVLRTRLNSETARYRLPLSKRAMRLRLPSLIACCWCGCGRCHSGVVEVVLTILASSSH